MLENAVGETFSMGLARPLILIQELIEVALNESTCIFHINLRIAVTHNNTENSEHFWCQQSNSA